MANITDNVLGLCDTNSFCPWEHFKLDENSLVVDLGAHEGSFSKYILDTYNCRVDAYEPSMDCKLVHPKLRVFTEPVWDGTPVRFMSHQGPSGHVGLGEKVNGINIADITKEHINLMKVNIEGSEMIVLELADLSNVDQLIVEFHAFRAELGIKQEDIDALVEKIKGYGYKSIHKINNAPSYMFWNK